MGTRNVEKKRVEGLLADLWGPPRDRGDVLFIKRSKYQREKTCRDPAAKEVVSWTWKG
jgi:hypothetical protein